MDEVKWTLPWSLTSFTGILLKECISYRLKVMYCTANDISFLVSSFERKIKTDEYSSSLWKRHKLWKCLKCGQKTAYTTFILAPDREVFALWNNFIFKYSFLFIIDKIPHFPLLASWHLLCFQRNLKFFLLDMWRVEH